MKTYIKGLIAIAVLCFSFVNVIKAQPAAVRKVANSAFTITTFNSDNSIISKSYGIFVDNNGTAIAPWKIFIGADSAVVIDAQGRRLEFDYLIGADEIYDLAKFKVKGNVPSVSIDNNVKDNKTLWIVQPTKSGVPIQATMLNLEQFMSKFNYLILQSTASENENGAPVVNSNGKVVGIFKATTTSQSATDIAYPLDFSLKGLSQNDVTMRQSKLRIGLPQNISEATIALMLSTEKSPKVYQATINDFIDKFPNSNEGYYTKANSFISARRFKDADEILQSAISKATPKDEALFNYARLIYLNSINPSSHEEVQSIGWSLDKAQTELQKAIKIKTSDAYQHLGAQILFAKKEYDLAFSQFESLSKTSFKNPELYLEMAQCKQLLAASDEEVLNLLNKCIELCDTPYVSTSSPYFFARGQQLEKMGQYRKAVQDYYTYEYFNPGRLSAEFYYMREQCEVKGRLWQQALQDILIASRLSPDEPLYPTEAASLLLRLNKLDGAINAAQQAIQLDASQSEAYLVLGVAQCLKKDRGNGIQNILKAKELGNAQAESFLEKYQ